MTQGHLHQVEALIQQTRDVLAAFRAGRVPDLDTVESRRGRLLEELRGLGDADPDAPDADHLAERLELLGRLNDELMAVMRTLIRETGSRLGNVRRGRRGLAGYRAAAAAGRPRRVPRGIG